MPTQNPRILTTLEPPLYRTVERLARKEGVPLSQMVRNMIKESLEIMEDSGWEAIVNRRGKTPGHWITHTEMKKRLKLK